MHPRITNIPTQTFDDCRFNFESAGVLALDNEYSGFAALPAHVLRMSVNTPGLGIGVGIMCVVD
jgi:hypothetical protein